VREPNENLIVAGYSVEYLKVSLDMAHKALTLGIYYTNTTPVSTNIWPEFATKLCFFPLVREEAFGFAVLREFSTGTRTGNRVDSELRSHSAATVDRLRINLHRSGSFLCAGGAFLR